MTTDHLTEQLEAIVIKHKANNIRSIEAKQECVAVAKRWMRESDLPISEKFNEWNSVMAHLVVKHGITGAKT